MLVPYPTKATKVNKHTMILKTVGALFSPSILFTLGSLSHFQVGVFFLRKNKQTHLRRSPNPNKANKYRLRNALDLVSRAFAPPRATIF